jgi:polar amino acid transport system substrate-binding protein
MLIKRIAAMECLKLDIKLTSSAAVLESVRRGLGDVALGGWYITPERGKVLGQTAPLFCDPTAIVSKRGYSTLAQLQGKNVAVVQGTLFVEGLQKVLGSNHVSLYQSSDAAFQDVVVGRVDAWVGGFGEGVIFKNSRKDAHVEVKAMRPDKRFTPSLAYGQANLPYPKKNSQLGAALSADIGELKARGILKRIYDTVPLPLVGSRQCPTKIT